VYRPGRLEGTVDKAAYVFCVLEQFHRLLKRREVFTVASQRWADPRAQLLSGAAWEQARPAALNALQLPQRPYHLDDPLSAVREARRVLRRHGVLIVVTIARSDSPELDAYWKRPSISFDAEDASQLIGEVFDAVITHPWDAPLITLPSRTAIRDYLLGRQAPPQAGP
jgi:hypothetical protein